MKYPAILPHNHIISDWLIDQAHSMFHGGVRLTLAWLRQQYWIVGGNNAVKKRLRTCVTYRRHDPIKHSQLMGDLSAPRTTRPFYHTRVDFTGFVDVKSAKGRGVRCTKGYIVVFVCMATKAIHLELVSDLTASAFTAALRRCVAKRGAPGHVYSDNGINFIKANRLIIIDLQSLLDDYFYTELTGMEWALGRVVELHPGKDGLIRGSKQGNKHCNHLDKISTNLQDEAQLFLLLRRSYNELQRYGNIMPSHKFPRGHARRRRRGLINAVGNVAHTLFGVLAVQYKQDIDLIRAKQNHLAALWKNQVDKQHKVFNSYLNQLEEENNMLKNQMWSLRRGSDVHSTSMARVSPACC